MVGRAVVLLLVCIATVRATAAGPSQPGQILRAALDAYDQAVAAEARGDRAAAMRGFEEAAGGFQSLLEQGYRNASLEYNLGNAYLRLGRLGYAILHYRRALELAPRDPDVRANLELARQRVHPQIHPSGRRALVDRLLIVRHWLPPATRWQAGVALSTLGWLLAVVWLLRRRGALLLAAAVAVIPGVLLQIELLSELHDQQRRPEAVVVGQPVELRRGRGEAYEPVLPEPLGPGVELRIVETRGDWVRVQLRNDTGGWLPQPAVRLIPASTAAGG